MICQFCVNIAYVVHVICVTIDAVVIDAWGNGNICNNVDNYQIAIASQD